MTDEERDGQQRIIDEALAQLAEEAGVRGEDFDPQGVNLAELAHMTGISRSRLRTLKKRGFRVGHGNTGRRKAHPVLEGFTDMVDDKLRKGVTNCGKILDDLRKGGLQGRPHDGQGLREGAQGPRASAARAGARGLAP